MNEYFDELSSFNYWNGQLPECGFIRKSYLNRLTGYKGNKLVKVLVGQRGAGKSYLLRQVAQQLMEGGVSGRNLLCISKAFTDSGVLTDRRALDDILFTYREKLHPVGKVYLLIEEIQNIDGWESFVYAHSQDNVESYELFISGSNLQMLSSAAVPLLSKHCVSFEVFPFSYAEHTAMIREEASGKSFKSYMEGGALPQLFALSTEEGKRRSISALRDTVLLRDVIQKYRIKESRLLEDVLVFLSKHLSESVSMTDLVRHFTSLNRKTSYDTVANYIRVLEETFLIHRVERYHIKNKEIVSGNCKYYINDWSLMRYIYPFFVRSQASKLENQVYLELRRAGYSVFSGVLRGRTIDFVARKGDRVIYLQCTPTVTDEYVLAQLYASLEAIPDNYEKWVVTLDEVTLPSNEGIRHIQAWQLPIL